MEETLGKRIMAHRKRLKLTQDQLAEKLGVTAQAVSKWENDQSCPDINMLPRLAQLFGTTTDALLGNEPIYEAEVVTPEHEDEKTYVEWRAGNSGAIFFALFVLLVGGLLLAAKLLSWEVGFWEICWPSALLLFGLSQVFKRLRFAGAACTLLGVYFLLKNLDVLHIRIGTDIVLAGLIVMLGLCLLVDALHKPKKPTIHVGHGGKKETKQHYSQTEDRFECSLSFGEETKRVELARLAGGEVSCSFGELRLDLCGCARVTDECCIEASCSFGRLCLIVPRRLRVISDSGASFGSVDTVGFPDDKPEGSIRLKGNVSFGDISIEYV